jgi:nicotinamide-nucleotide amidase
MQAVVMSVGSELLGGFLTDTNATFLAQDMSALGIELVGVMQTGDDLERLVRTLGRATEDADLVVITGGVGPTEDDLTREAIAAFVGEEVRVDPELLRTVERFFASRGIVMPPRNEKQAWLIPSAEALPNPAGTAPGWMVRHRGKVIVSMPGVPREMTRMWRDQVVPRLAGSLGSLAIVSTTVKTIGIGESAAEDMIAHIIHRGHPVVATYAKDDGVHIRITATDDSRDAAAASVAETEGEVRSIFGAHAYGGLETRLGSAILDRVARLNARLRVEEAGSAGRITNLLAEETALERYFAGGRIETFADVAHLAGVKPGATDAHVLVARHLVAEPASDDGADSARFAIAVDFRPAEHPDRRSGAIAFALNIGGDIHEREHRVEASPFEIRRRAALWAGEFLLVNLTHRLSGVDG